MAWVQRRVNSQKESNCERCGCRTILRKSHAIPDAIFRSMKRSNRGKITKIHQDLGVRPTAESGWAYMLCGHCEKHFNTICDQAVVKFVNNGDVQDPLKKIDHNILAIFICSVLWRAQLSSASMYAGYNITELDAKKITNVALEKSNPFSEFSYEIAYMIDDIGQIDENMIKNTIAAPYRAEVKLGLQTHTIHHFVAGGIFFAALYPIVPTVISDNRYLFPNSSHFPTAIRALSSLSSFRKLENMAREEGFRQRKPNSIRN